MATKKVLLKIIVLGESGVGKSVLLNKYVMNKFMEEYKATIGADFSNKDIQIKDKLVTLQMWDTAGQERFQTLGNTFYRGADACVLVYDVTNEQTFHKIDELKSKFLELSGKSPENFPFLLLGNKIDLDDQRSVNESTARNYAKNNNLIFYETSAVNGHNIDEAIRELSDKAIEMDSAPIFSTEPIEMLKYETIEDTFAGDEPATAVIDVMYFTVYTPSDVIPLIIKCEILLL